MCIGGIYHGKHDVKHLYNGEVWKEILSVNEIEKERSLEQRQFDFYGTNKIPIQKKLRKDFLKDIFSGTLVIRQKLAVARTEKK